MPSSRRRFLTCVAAVTATVAGCNETSPQSVEETVTPVDVPRTDEEVLAEVAEIDVPEIPTPVVVSDAHLEAAIDQVERLRESVAERLESTDGSVRFDDLVSTPPTPEALFETIDEGLAEAREADPSQAALDGLRPSREAAATAAGYLGAETDTLELADLREEIEAERAAARRVRDRFEYRIASPVAEHLPTLYAAERALADVDFGRAERLNFDGEGDAVEWSGRAAEVKNVLERNRRRREDAERYRETATDGDAASVRTAIATRQDAVREQLESIVTEYGSRGRDRPDESTVRGELRAIRWSVGERCERHLAEEDDHREDGSRVRHLIAGIELTVEFTSLDSAVERTIDRLDGSEFPTTALREEKERAVEGVERAAEETALQRRLAARSTGMLASGDHFGRRNGGDPRILARAHLVYVGAGEWADRALDRGDALAAALEAQQS